MAELRHVSFLLKIDQPGVVVVVLVVRGADGNEQAEDSRGGHYGTCRNYCEVGLEMVVPLA